MRKQEKSLNWCKAAAKAVQAHAISLEKAESNARVYAKALDEVNTITHTPTWSRQHGNRLFKVTNTRTKKDANGTFKAKPTAKLYRDELNGGLSTEEDKVWNKDVGWRVVVGPDHWMYES